MKATARRFNVVDCGRRWGKTILGEDVLLQPALSPGLPVAWFAPTYKYLADVWRDVSGIVRPLIRTTNVQERRIELITGGVIDMWTMHDAPGRGRKYARIVVDEAAWQQDLMEVWRADIRPTLTDYSGDAWFFSTPKGRNGFWQMWQRGQDDTQREWKSWKPFPTSENPYLNLGEIEAARQDLPERIFSQEYLAQFLEDAGGVFRGVIACTTAIEQPAIEGHQYIMGVDWGKLVDFTVLSVVDATTKQQVALDRFNKIDYLFQTQRLKTLAERYNAQSIIAEANAMGGPLIEQLKREGLPVQPFTTTNATKAKIIEGLSLAFERHEIEILPDPVQVGELQAFEMHRLPSGLTRYSAPEGMHDDCVMSLALSWYGASKPKGVYFA